MLPVDDYEMEIENDSFLDFNGQISSANSLQRVNSQATKSKFVEARPTEYFDFKKMSDRNNRGEFEVRVTIEIPSNHPVLSQI